MANKEARAFKAMIMDAYGMEGEDQHNKNIEIMVDCFLEDKKSYDWTIDIFAEYASDENNLDKFIKRGAVVL
jgi:hypothetical protein